MSDGRPACERCPCPGECLRLPTYCEWAARPEPDPVEIRHICDASRARRAGGERPAPVGPSLPRMAVNLASALWEWAISGFSMTGESEQERRLAICKTCDFHDEGRCLHMGCGCFLVAKVKLKSEHCPLDPPKW